MKLDIEMVCPAPPGSRTGNRITAVRWARILRALGHRVHITTSTREAGAAGGGDHAARDPDLLIALHARRSAGAVRAFRARHPKRPIIVALTGTDVYGDIAHSHAARRSFEAADRLVVLQPTAIDELWPAVREKARVIYQSALPAPRPKRRASEKSARGAHGTFDVCVLAHLRAVKDPLRAAMAARELAPQSRLRVLHAGRALTEAMSTRARREMKCNPRYRWLGERSHRGALALLSRSHMLVVSSRLEGGANVIGEAAVAGVPVLASRVPGNIGLLGPRYGGLFAFGDTHALADLLARAEDDARFYEQLRRGTTALSTLFHPSRERRAWRDLLCELV